MLNTQWFIGHFIVKNVIEKWNYEIRTHAYNSLQFFFFDVLNWSVVGCSLWGFKSIEFLFLAGTYTQTHTNKHTHTPECMHKIHIEIGSVNGKLNSHVPFSHSRTYVTFVDNDETNGQLSPLVWYLLFFFVTCGPLFFGCIDAVYKCVSVSVRLLPNAIFIFYLSVIYANIIFFSEP